MIKTLGQMPRQLFSSPHPMVSLSLASLDLTDEEADTMVSLLFKFSLSKTQNKNICYIILY